MKYKKIIAIMMLATSVSLTGCSTSFRESFGDITPEVIKRQSVVSLGDTYFDKNQVYLTLATIQFQTESQALKSGQLTSDMWSQPQNEGEGTLAETTKEGVLKNIKQTIALLAHAKDYDVKLEEKDKTYALHQARTILGQQYDNKLLDFWKSKGIQIDEKTIYNYLTSDILAQKVSQSAMNAQTVDLDIKHAVKAEQIIVPVLSDEESSKEKAEEIKKALVDGKNIDLVAKENKLGKSDVVLSDKLLEDEGISPEDKKLMQKVLESKNGDIVILENKDNDGKIKNFIVIKVVAVDTPEIIREANNQISGPRKSTQLNELVDKWISQVHVNENLFNEYKFETDMSFWDPIIKLQGILS